jgi:hypothetical protein
MDLHTITMEEARTAAGDRRFGPSVQGQELIVCEITVGHALGELPGGTSPDDVPIWTASTEKSGFRAPCWADEKNWETC